MAAEQVVGQEGTRVKRLRVSYVATRIRDDMRVVGEPEAFASRFVSLDPILGVEIGLPFGPEAGVEASFWSTLAEGQVREPMAMEDARRLRRAGVPLRHSGRLVGRVETPRLEAHIHPFGVVVLASIDLIWDEPVPLEGVWERVEQMADDVARVTIGPATRETSIAAAARSGVEALTETFAGPSGSSWDMADHRIATIIDGSAHEGAMAMPPPRGTLQVALHRLSAGGGVLPDPGSGFVAQWSGASFDWAPGQLVYMLDAGTSILCRNEIASLPLNRHTTLAARHRRAALLLAHVTASVGLVRAAPAANSPYFSDWAKKAADRLGRLYGPARPNANWGLETRSYLSRIGAIGDVASLRGSPLTENFRSPPYV